MKKIEWSQVKRCKNFIYLIIDSYCKAERWENGSRKMERGWCTSQLQQNKKMQRARLMSVHISRRRNLLLITFSVMESWTRTSVLQVTRDDRAIHGFHETCGFLHQHLDAWPHSGWLEGLFQSTKKSISNSPDLNQRDSWLHFKFKEEIWSQKLATHELELNDAVHGTDSWPKRFVS